MAPDPVGPVNEQATRLHIEAVRTDRAAFIGYTGQAQSNETSLLLVPTRVDSMIEYERLFGGAPAAESPYLLYDSLTLFFANGGVECVVVSVGTYDRPVTEQALVSGLTPLADVSDVAIVVMPETVRLSPEDSMSAQHALLAHCGEVTGNRFAILDIPAGDQPPHPASPAAAFAAALATTNRSFGAAYYPWLLMTPPRLHGSIRLVPPSGAIAGVFATVDNTRGVSKAPANVALSGVTAPAVSLSATDLDSLISPATGVGVNAIRTLTGKGTLVWGARTLDANSADWRYISVRRTTLMIEESVRLALQAFVFEPNTLATWTAVRTAVNDFLTGLWRAGTLPGATARQAFSVRIGVGDTMTEQDIADGRLVLELMLALVRPAEFIVVTLVQTMSAS